MGHGGEQAVKPQSCHKKPTDSKLNSAHLDRLHRTVEHLSTRRNISTTKLQKMKVWAVIFTVLVMASLVAATFNLPSFADLKAKKAEQKAAKANQTTTTAAPAQSRNSNETVTATPVTNNGSRIIWVQQMVYVPVLVNDKTSEPLSLRSGLRPQMGGIPSSVFSKAMKASIAAPPGKDSPYLAYSASNPPVVGIVASAKASSDDQAQESRVAAAVVVDEVATEAPANPPEARVADAVPVEVNPEANVPVYGIGPSEAN